METPTLKISECKETFRFEYHGQDFGWFEKKWEKDGICSFASSIDSQKFTALRTGATLIPFNPFMSFGYGDAEFKVLAASESFIDRLTAINTEAGSNKAENEENQSKTA